MGSPWGRCMAYKQRERRLGRGSEREVEGGRMMKEKWGERRGYQKEGRPDRERQWEERESSMPATRYHYWFTGCVNWTRYMISSLSDVLAVFFVGWFSPKLKVCLTNSWNVSYWKGRITVLIMVKRAVKLLKGEDGTLLVVSQKHLVM